MTLGLTDDLAGWGGLPVAAPPVAHRARYTLVAMMVVRHVMQLGRGYGAAYE